MADGSAAFGWCRQIRRSMRREVMLARNMPVSYMHQALGSLASDTRIRNQCAALVAASISDLKSCPGMRAVNSSAKVTFAFRPERARETSETARAASASTPTR